MDKAELLKKVRTIEIKTRGLSNHIFSGEYHSAFKGRGMSFSEVREYQYGDDVRNIEWNVTARFGHPYVKVFEEERELTVILLVDMSRSERFGTQKQFKNDLITELTAVISFSAIQNNDKIGVIFFTDKIEKFIPPKKGKSHILRIISDLIEFKPDNTGTDINAALRFFNNAIKKRCIAFLISDFLDSRFDESVIRLTARKHDLVALRLYDQAEGSLPDMGLVQFADPETGAQKWIDTSNPNTKAHYARQWKELEKKLSGIFTKTGTDNVRLKVDQNYVQPLMTMFKQRASKA